MEAVGAPVYNYVKVDPSLYQRTKASVRSQLGEEAFETAWAEGRAMTFEQAVAYALDEDNEASRAWHGWPFGRPRWCPVRRGS